MDLNSILAEIAIMAPPFLFALTVHELAHGLAAHRLGDPTAARLGRLTLNPLKHLDLLGVAAFFIMKIGWAKPVPVNPGYFRNPARGLLWVSLAGPGANLLLAVASGLGARVLALASPLLPAFFWWPAIQMAAASIWINIMLAVFNFLPVPPLDGSKILAALLPRGPAAVFAKAEPYGFLILIALFYTGALQKIILPIIAFAQGIIVG
ncbi:MAG: site-2 protease family protein [Desulfobacteraceae bacterium]|nr:site-2 protease family protein [Desulfobacteraceae bacterium]